jgi:hypothetical protein
MADFLLRLAGSTVVGWLLGAAAGSTVSRVVYGDGGALLPLLFVPLTIVIVFLASYALVPHRP